MDLTDILSTIGGLIIVVCMVLVIMGVPIMLLWNWLMPAIFGITKITFWQAIGISFLSAFLFKGYVRNRD